MNISKTRMSQAAVLTAVPEDMDWSEPLEAQGWEKSAMGSYKTTWLKDDSFIVLKRGGDAIREVDRIDALKPSAQELFAPAVVVDRAREITAMQRVAVSDFGSRGDSAAMRLLVKLGDERGFYYKDAKYNNCGYIGVNTLVWIDFGTGS